MSTTQITIHAETRTTHGKSAARRLRAAGKLPAIVYGHGIPSRGIAIDPKDIKAILAAPLGRNTVVTLDVAGDASLALLKTFDHHPISRLVEHADFYAVTLDKPVTVHVPLLLTGRARGVATDGGVVRQVFRTLPVKCIATLIPARIETDITHLGLSESLHVRDLVLPEGVVVALDASQTIVSIVAPEKEEKVAEAAPGAVPVAGAVAAVAGAKAAAPAAGAKAAAPAAKASPAKKK